MPTSQDIIDRAHTILSKEPLHSNVSAFVAQVEVSDDVKTIAWGTVFPGDPVPGVDPGPPGPTPGIEYTQSITFKEIDDFGTIYHDFNAQSGDLYDDLGIELVRTQAGPPPLLVIGFRDVESRTKFNRGADLVTWSFDGVDLKAASGWQNDDIDGLPVILDLDSEVPIGLGPYDMVWEAA